MLLSSFAPLVPVSVCVCPCVCVPSRWALLFFWPALTPPAAVGRCDTIAFAATVISPLELIRTKMQAGRAKDYKGTRQPRR